MHLMHRQGWRMSTNLQACQAQPCGFSTYKPVHFQKARTTKPCALIDREWGLCTRQSTHGWALTLPTYT